MARIIEGDQGEVGGTDARALSLDDSPARYTQTELQCKLSSDFEFRAHSPKRWSIRVYERGIVIVAKEESS